MSEPNQATNSKPGEQSASTPPQADKPETTISERTLEDFLDIPPEIQSQLKTTLVPDNQIEPQGDLVPADEAEPTAPVDQQVAEPEVKPERKEGEEDDDSDDEESEDESLPKPSKEEQQQPKPFDKRDKRIARLTRKKHELETTVEGYESKLGELKDRLASLEKGEQPTVPSGLGSALSKVSTERDVQKQVEVARSALQWLDDHDSDGGISVTDNGQERFIEPAEIKKIRRQHENVVRDAPLRLREIEKHEKAKAEFDQFSNVLWPELEKRDSQERQIASAYRDKYPILNALPEGSYVIGLLVEGAKSVHARIEAAKKNGEGNGQKERKDISPRAFEPRVPIAPSTSEPPVPKAKPSTAKKVDEAMTNLINDPDGSASSLAKVFAAEDEGRRQSPSRTPVRV